MKELVKDYVKNIDEYTIIKFSQSKGINLTDDEVKIVYLYLKNYWENFYDGNCEDLWIELKEQLTDTNYIKIKNLYEEYKK